MSEWKVDRREFLKWLAGGAVSATLGHLGAGSARALTRPAVSASGPAVPDKSLVVRVRSSRVLTYEGVNRRILREMITDGLNELTGTSSLSAALKEHFSKKDVIGFKFNSSGARLLGTNTTLAEELLRLMIRHGYDPERLVFIEVQPGDDTLPPCRKVPFGWGREISFGSGKDSFAAVVDQVTALVNVGTLKANAVAGMSGCLKNLSYGLIKHPARYHDRHCTPYIADIYRLPILGDKVRFNLLNALRVLLGDPHRHKECVAESGSLLFGHDVVAVDATGYELYDQLRKKKGFPPPLIDGDFPPQLLAAARRGLGVYHPDRIQLKTIDLGAG